MFEMKSELIQTHIIFQLKYLQILKIEIVNLFITIL